MSGMIAFTVLIFAKYLLAGWWMKPRIITGLEIVQNHWPETYGSVIKLGRWKWRKVGWVFNQDAYVYRRTF